MLKRTLVLGLFLVMTVVVCSAAYADNMGETNAFQGAWNSTGGFFYNALPWNWGNWAGR